MQLGESLEDYLETILILQESKDKVRLIDIATKLKVSKPSVNKAMSILKNKGYVTQERYKDIKLTEEGYAIAEQVLHRHNEILNFLVNTLGVSKENAEEDACKIEHVISSETFTKICEFKNQK